MANPESRLQMVVVEHLELALPSDAIFWATMNERKIPRHLGPYYRAMGRVPGVPDLVVIYKGRALGIELKLPTSKVYGTKKTYQTQAQKDFQERMQAAGACYEVCRSLAEVRVFLERCGVPLRVKEVV